MPNPSTTLAQKREEWQRSFEELPNDGLIPAFFLGTDVGPFLAPQPPLGLYKYLK
jgi:hypothetical protein